MKCMMSLGAFELIKLRFDHKSSLLRVETLALPYVMKIQRDPVGRHEFKFLKMNSLLNSSKLFFVERSKI